MSTDETLDAGIHPNVDEARYHADPCERPSLSASLASVICQRSPRHAWARHPRLNPDFKPVESTTFDFGNVAHKLLLEGEDICAVCEFDDWRTKAAQEARENARIAGKVPLLARQWTDAQRLRDALRAQLDEITDAIPPILQDGRPEQTIVWEEPNGVICRARPDWLRNDSQAVDDVKTTTASAHPRDWTRRRMWETGADLQAVFYMRGVQAITGATPVFRFVVVETTAPYALSVVSLAPAALQLAREKVDYAIAMFGACLRDGDWPAYTRRVAYAEPPSWEETRWMEERYADEAAAA